ncbi:MAG: glutamate-5-semialdehyde dehydrogenase [Candidatus Erginobacter occultus]|nr:glutamate-5-semialdehyde dehydrogenase [Candidatus Erginobacter occultus]
MVKNIELPWMEKICLGAREASYKMAVLETAAKNAALRAMATALAESRDAILAANAADLVEAEEKGTAPQLLDRLRLTEAKLEGTIRGVREVADLPDPVGEELERTARPNGLVIRRVRVPLGVVAIVYEARPEVSADASCLALKAGNAVILRGSSIARRSDGAITTAAASALERAGLPAGALQLASGGGHQALAALATRDRDIDLLIPRGGESLKAALLKVATVPLLFAADGNCHVYVDAAADPEMAIEITINSKTQKVAVCNAAETLLVHKEIAADFLPRALRALAERGVELRLDQRARALAPADLNPPPKDAVAADWDTEYLAPILAVGVVDSLEAAIAHINRHGSHHSDAIVTADERAARTFQQSVDSAAVFWNASTRFTDGNRFGMGAEMGISTQKLHARGPIGLRELCSYKFVIDGTGQLVS